MMGLLSPKRLLSVIHFNNQGRLTVKWAALKMLSDLRVTHYQIHLV